MSRAILMLLGMLTLAGVMASGDGERFTSNHPAWREECGSCHIPYPPEMLPAASWTLIMGRLDRHFGVDASIEPAVARQIHDFLNAHAAKGRYSGHDGKLPLRITELSWFLHDHHEVPRATFQSAKVKSPSNCGACHPRADRGDFGDDSP